MSCICGGESYAEKKAKKRKQQYLNNSIDSYNHSKEEQWQQSRELEAQVYKQLNTTNNGKMLSFYGRPMNLQNEQKELDLPTKSEVERYSNQHEKEEGFVAQGNIYGNQGYSYGNDIYRNKEQKYNNIKKASQHAKKNIRSKNNNCNNNKEPNNERITLNIYGSNRHIYH